MKASDIQVYITLTLFYLCSALILGTGLTGCHSIRKVLKPSEELPVTEIESPKKKKKANQSNQQVTPKTENGSSEKVITDKKNTEHLYNKKKKSNEKNIVSNEIETIIKTAESYLGTPYSWGGMSRKGVDCSGLIVLAYKSVDKKIARVSGEQAKAGKPVTKNELKKGDLLFFASRSKGVIGHTALVVEVNGKSVKFIHASNSGVRYDYLESEHWTKMYICARRYGD